MYVYNLTKVNMSISVAAKSRLQSLFVFLQLKTLCSMKDLKHCN